MEGRFGDPEGVEDVFLHVCAERRGATETLDEASQELKVPAVDPGDARLCH